MRTLIRNYPTIASTLALAVALNGHERLHPCTVGPPEAQVGQTVNAAELVN